MADASLTVARRGIGALPVAVRIAVVYLVARLVTVAFLLIAAELSAAGSRFGPDATIADLSAGWDTQWYWVVAANGYPHDLPLTSDGFVRENAWAFMPLFAYLASFVGFFVGSWVAGAVIVSLGAGYLACLALYRLLRERIDETAALWAVVFFAAGPLAALFHLGYAETLFLLWLFLALWVLERRAYGWLYLLIPLMGFTRPGVLAFALLLGLHGIMRWTTRRRDGLPARDVVNIVLLGALAVVVGFGWTVIAALVTGRPDAYLATELAWRRNWIVGEEAHFAPFEGFVQGAAFWGGQWGIGAVGGYVLLVLIVVGAGLMLWRSPQVRRLGPDLRLWSASYLLYLLAVFFPQSSIFRLLVPLAPLWGAAALPKVWWWRPSVLALCLLGQWWWIYNMFALGNTITQIP